MHVAAVRIELRFSEPHSLEDKRAVLEPVIEDVRRRHCASVAEVDHQDQWQRAAIGVAAGIRPSPVDELLDHIEEFVGRFPNSRC